MGFDLIVAVGNIFTSTYCETIWIQYAMWEHVYRSQICCLQLVACKFLYFCIMSIPYQKKGNLCSYLQSVHESPCIFSLSCLVNLQTKSVSFPGPSFNPCPTESSAGNCDKQLNLSWRVVLLLVIVVLISFCYVQQVVKHEFEGLQFINLVGGLL